MNDTNQPQWFIASVSFGKDSLAMLLRLIQDKYPLDEVVFYDTGMEFEAVYQLRDKVELLCKKKKILFTVLKPPYDFEYQMFDKPIKNRDGSGYHYGYSWCGGRCRWGTEYKTLTIHKYAKSKNAKVYVGIAADEAHRLGKEYQPYKLYPMIDWGMTEADALIYCHERNYYWNEEGIELYALLDRVSCYCCANKNLKELKNIYRYLPKYWDKLKVLQSKTDRPMKGYYKGNAKGIFELEERFRKEIENEKC